MTDELAAITPPTTDMKGEEELPPLDTATTVATPPGIVLGVLDGGDWSAAFGSSIIDMILHDAVGPQSIAREGCGMFRLRAESGTIGDSRSRIARNFLRSGADYLLFVDSDMGFPPDMADRLVATAIAQNASIVTGLCFGLKRVIYKTALNGERNSIKPTVYRWVDLQVDGQDPEIGFAPMYDYPKDAPFEVDGCGAAALLISREVVSTLLMTGAAKGVFDRVTHPVDYPDGSPRRFSEDLSFCIRAKAAGFRIVCDPSVKLTHDKGGLWCDETMYEAYRAIGVGADGTTQVV